MRKRIKQIPTHNGAHRYAHPLILEALKGPSWLITNHKDGNKLNNNINNLEYCTSKQNRDHALDSGLAGVVFMGIETVSLINKHLLLGIPKQDIADIFELPYSLICRIANGDTPYDSIDDHGYCF